MESGVHMRSSILYDKIRKPDADAIAELALNNFIEMRDLVIDEKFLWRKKIESKLNDLYPTEWISLYEMVTFSNLRYSEALRLGKIQEELMKKTVNKMKSEQDRESIDYLHLIEEYKRMK
jgi:kynurenine 3-monooxygenase